MGVPLPTRDAVRGWCAAGTIFLEPTVYVCSSTPCHEGAQKVTAEGFHRVPMNRNSACALRKYPRRRHLCWIYALATTTSVRCGERIALSAALAPQERSGVQRW